MLFSWANKQLEKLSETMAPMTNAATGKFIQALQHDDIQTAKTLLSTSNSEGNSHSHSHSYSNNNSTGTNTKPAQFINPYETIFHPSKQSKAIHMACQYSNKVIFTYILQTFYESHNHNLNQVLSTTDAQGHTILHYACMSLHSNRQHALSFVQYLVEMFNNLQLSSILVAKSSSGQTAYDVATNNDLIRQYLLPRQLQMETQECLDNGGVGLPKGMDLGGLKIHSNIAPPPVMGMGTGAITPSTPLQSPPGGGGGGSNNNIYSIANNGGTWYWWS